MEVIGYLGEVVYHPSNVSFTTNMHNIAVIVKYVVCRHCTSTNSLLTAMTKAKQRQKHFAHKPDSGGGGDMVTRTAKPVSYSKPASSQNHWHSRHRFQMTLLLSVLVALISILAIVYWVEIIRGTALLVATVKALLYRPAPKPIEYLLGDNILPKAQKKPKYTGMQREFVDPNSASLHKKFALDFKQVQRIRLHNMKKYSFNYSVYGIDRRANLSLQEFRDVYDGKW